MASDLNGLPRAFENDLRGSSLIMTSLVMSDLSPPKKTYNLLMSKLVIPEAYLANDFSLVENSQTVILPYFRWRNSWAFI